MCAAKTIAPAPELPIARVLPLTGVPMLDRYFDYKVRDSQHEDCQPGVRVRIRLAGTLYDAIVIERLESSDFDGRLMWVEKVISPERVYTPELHELVQALALRYAGLRPDIIRAAIPQRHATAEKNFNPDITWEELGEVEEPDLSPWLSYQFGQSFIDAVVAGRPVRAAWQVCPGTDWAETLAPLLAKVAMDGGGVLVVLPDLRDVDAVDNALRRFMSASQITTLYSTLGNQARYSRYLKILHGTGRIVVGTRSAAFAPVKNLKLAVIFDDGDENLVDPRAPYVHAREVLITRSRLENTALIMGGISRTAEVQQLVNHGWAHDVVAPPALIMRTRPKVFVAPGQPRIPSIAFKVVNETLNAGKAVLISSPRTGYVPVLGCAQCRKQARCRACNGPLTLKEGLGGQFAVPTCSWCGRPEGHFRCPDCGCANVRARTIGAERLAEEIGGAFRGRPIIVSGGNTIRDSVPDGPRIVVATPGAEPKGDYGALIIVDTWTHVNWPDLRAHEQALATWVRAASLLGPESSVVISIDTDIPIVQKFVQWDMVGAAQAELEDRIATGLPPAQTMAAVDAPATVITRILEKIDNVQPNLDGTSAMPEGINLLGPTDLPVGMKLPGEYDQQRFGAPQRLFFQAPLGMGEELVRFLRSLRAEHNARKEDLPLRIQVDPIHIG
ncbi:MAG: primosomal protein N' [Corynebacterium sp.]|nr:primosomal protein N' [Corynebacterium sp.]